MPYRPMFSAILLLALAAPGQCFEAVTAPAYDADLALPVAGRIAKVGVRAGDTVEPGALLAQLDDAEAQALVALARADAQNDAEVQSARQRLEIAKMHEDEAKARHALGGPAPEAAESQRAQADVNAALQRQAAAAAQFTLAQTRLAQCALHAPAAGVVEELRVTEGQYIPAGQKLVRLVSTRTLIAEVPVPSERADGLIVGGPAWVTPRQSAPPAPGSPAPVPAATPGTGRIIFVASVLNPITDTRLVRVEIDNAGAKLAAGARVDVAFTDPQPPVSRPADKSGPTVPPVPAPTESK